MNYKGGIAAIASLALFLTACGGTESSVFSASDPVPTEKHMVILGDSISAGYGLESPVTDKYSTLLMNMLNKNDDQIVWSEYNYAVSGDDTTDLIDRLESGRAVRLPSADTIIICIGANNLLGAYTNYLQSLIGDADVAQMTDEELEQLESNILEKMQNDTDIQTELETVIDEGLVRMENDLETIYTWIRERNADADIYVMNIYNPYAGVTQTLPNTDLEMGAFSSEQLERCNKILSAWEAAHTDLIPVDLAEEFAGYDPVPIIGDTSGAGDVYLDPHPNAEGHKIIADLLFETISRTQAAS